MVRRDVPGMAHILPGEIPCNDRAISGRIVAAGDKASFERGCAKAMKSTMETKNNTRGTCENRTEENTRIRVLFVISDLSGGGAERAVSTYLHHLDRNRFEPGLCLWRNVFAYEVPEDVPVWVMNKNKPWHAPRTIWRMARRIDRWQPDVVLSFLAYVNLITGFAVNLCGGHPSWIPVVRNNPHSPDQKLSNWLWTRMSKSWKRVGVISRGMSDAMVSEFKIPGKNIVNLDNPVDFSHIDASIGKKSVESKKPFTIITMGRLVKQKDHATLLKAVEFVDKFHSVRLVIMGEGPLRSKLERFAQELGVDNIVEFWGFMDNPFSHIAAADLFVLASKWEGLPKALTEAMGCGTAVVSTDCPYGPNEIIENGRSGILVPIGDPQSMADAILQLLDDSQMRARLASEGRTRVRKLYNASKCTHVLEDVLSNFVSP